MLPWMAAGAGILGLGAALVLWKFDPSRIHRLLTALTNPSKFASDSVWIPMMPRGVMIAMRLVPSAGFALTVIPSLIIVWRRRRSLPAADAALVAGLALTVLALTGPWFSMDKMIRFSLIAMLPAVIVAAFAILNITTAWRRWAVLGVVLCAGIGSNAPALQRGGRAILSDAAMSELKSLSHHITQPERTIVCAQHGPEWWSAWFLRTRISQPGALRPDDWQRYEEVFFLEVKSGLQVPQFGPPGAGKPGAVPPMPSNGINPFMSAQIPPDAPVLHDGPCLKFARVLTPPPDILLAGAVPAAETTDGDRAAQLPLDNVITGEVADAALKASKPESLPAMKKSAANTPRGGPAFECMGLDWDVPGRPDGRHSHCERAPRCYLRLRHFRLGPARCAPAPLEVFDAASGLPSAFHAWSCVWLVEAEDSCAFARSHQGLMTRQLSTNADSTIAPPIQIMGVLIIES